MKFADDIAVTVDGLLSLQIEGLPKSNRALREFLKREGWPIVFTEKGKYLVLVEAVPEPFNSRIQRASAVRFFAHPPEFVPPTPILGGFANLSNRVCVEARLTVIFEVFRRSYQIISETDAAQGFAEDANTFTLPDHLQRAAILGVVRGGDQTQYLLKHLVERSAKPVVEGISERSGPGAAHRYTVISHSTIINWIKTFNRDGVLELGPKRGG